MDLWLWKEELISTLPAARERARAGVAYLDGKFGPGWENEVEVERVDIGSPLWCMLAQLGWKGKHCFLSLRRCVDYGFSCGLVMDLLILLAHIPFLGPLLPMRRLTRSYDLLNVAWKELLRQRRSQAMLPPPVPAAVAETPKPTVRMPRFTVAARIAKQYLPLSRFDLPARKAHRRQGRHSRTHGAVRRRVHRALPGR